MSLKRYLLDSNAISDIVFRRHGVDDRALEHRRQGNHLGICVPVLGEFIGGLEYSASREKNLLLAKRGLDSFRIWPYDAAAAWKYGELYARLRRAGRTIQSVDLQIAAIALTLGNCTVVTTDSDFAAVQELPVVNWRI
ncbi:MAG: type II toxin-antitoxin system VapC family toxin [Pirellulales bacterium]